MADALIFTSSEVRLQSISLVGGKASQLSKIPLGSWQIPAWYVLSAKAWEQQCIYTGWARTWPEQAERLISIPSDSEEFEELCEEKQLEIEDTPLIARIEEALDHWWAHSTQAIHGWAVRPSLAAGDTRRTSFAGVLERFLFLKSLQEIKDAIRRSWASAYSVKAIRYRLEHGIGLEEIWPAIILQHMIPSDLSGELFTANPLNGRRDEAKIMAIGGIGDALQVGESKAETYILDLNSGEWKSHYRPFEKHVLDRHLTDRLMEMGEQLTLKLGSPQDIHWSIWDNHLYVLHARPILSLPPPPYEKSTRKIWSQLILEERVRGILSPLAFSFMRKAFMLLCQQRLMSQEQAAAIQLDKIFGLIGGRLYVNWEEWASLRQGLGAGKIEEEENTDMSFHQRIEQSCSKVDQLRFHRLHILQLMETIEEMNLDLLLQWQFSSPQADIDSAKAMVLGLYRELFLEIGRRLAFDGLLQKASDVAYLTMEELEAYCSGRSVTVNLNRLSSIREEEFSTYLSQEWPDQLQTVGPVYHHNDYAPMSFDTEASLDPLLNQWLFLLPELNETDV